jgi:hypothetical protein
LGGLFLDEIGRIEAHISYGPRLYQFVLAEYADPEEPREAWRLEGWERALSLLPILRDAPSGAPQDVVVFV